MHHPDSNNKYFVSFYIRIQWNNVNNGNIGNMALGVLNFKSKGTRNICNVGNISHVDLYSKSKGHGIMVILGILVILALDILIKKQRQSEYR